jgi:hypothetical protein
MHRPEDVHPGLILRVICSHGLGAAHGLRLRAGGHILKIYTTASLPTASWKARPPTLLQKGGWPVNPYGRDLNVFVDACRNMLNVEIVAAEFTPQQNQVIQFYLAAMAEKFPALLK